MVYFIIGFIVGAVLMLVALAIAAMGKDDETRNKVHFYVARDKNGELFLYMGKPFRGFRCIDRFHPNKNGCIVTSDNCFFNFGLNKDDYANLKWEDEPVEVFINMED